MTFLPKHTVQRRDLLNYQGSVHNSGIFVRSGSLSGVTGSTTGSVSITFDALAIRVKRVEVFHSGAALAFNFGIEKSTPNTGSFFDPRDIVIEYTNVPGGDSYRDGIDQIEDLITMTDTAGSLYLKFMPYGTGTNDFKYLIYSEGAFVYINKDGTYQNE